MQAGRWIDACDCMCCAEERAAGAAVAVVARAPVLEVRAALRRRCWRNSCGLMHGTHSNPIYLCFSRPFALMQPDCRTVQLQA